MGLNIYDIAEKSGVSISTVSRVMNNNPAISQATRERVLKVIEENNYIPSAFARGMNTNSMGLIGILCANIGDSFYSHALANLEYYLREQGLTAILAATGATLIGKQQGVKQMMEKSVDALVLVGSTYAEDAEVLMPLIGDKPVFTVNTVLDGPNAYSVKCDEKQATKEAVLVLVEAGCKAPLFLCGSISYSNKEKLAGYVEALVESGLQPDPTLQVALDHPNMTAEAVVNAIFAENRLSFDAVITSNDVLAIYALKAAKGAARDLPIIGFNNSEVSRLMMPQISSVDNMLEDMCLLTVKHLVSVLEGREVPHRTMIRGQLIRRETF